MIDWIQEIDWLLIVMVIIGVVVGTELRRRTVTGDGEIHSFLSPPTYHVGVVLAGVSMGLFFEAAKIAVTMPTAFHVWMLIGASALAFVSLMVFTGLEFKMAKRAVKEAATQSD